ncbi:alpha/beta hydrolase [Bacillus megaterium NBRC 15308 = ATCC 14581]|nr:alpha/beta hydrolase [Priestia megaterium NBRC 15308 = ATCC 14581]
MLLHGYYDHAGVLSTVIRFLIQQGFHVLTFDLPGHGLSTGERGAISEFFSIQKVLEKSYVDTCLRSLPVYIVAHSTGASAAVDYILNNPETSQIQQCLSRPSFGLIAECNHHFSKALKSVHQEFEEDTSRQFNRCKVFAFCEE